MPPIVVPNEALQTDAFWFLHVGGADIPTWELKLFSNDLTPDAGTELADFVEATFGGYAPGEMPPGDWELAIGPDNNAIATYGVEFTFTATATGGTAFGYYIVAPVGPFLTLAQRFDTPVPIETGTVIKIRPKLAFWSKYLPTP